MSESVNEKKILERLLVDEQETLQNIVERAEKFLRINKHTGEPVILISREILSKKDLIGLYIIARYFAFKLGLTSTDSITLEEIKRKTEMDEKIISARISELRREGIVEQVRRAEYRACIPNLVKFFDELGERYGK